MSKVTMKPFSFADEGADNIPFSVDTLEPIQETPAEETPQSTTTETPETTSSFSFEEDSPETQEGEEQIAEPSQETPKLTSSDVEFKTLGDFLVEAGIWKDFEGREEFEFTEDSFKTLWEAQARNSVGELLVEERNQFGSTANQLIDYLKNGGTVDDFVGNYTQQLDISSLDTTSPDGQEKAIKEYYSSLGWSDVKVKKHIERLKDSGASEFQEEADDCKTKLVEAIEEERAEMLKEQEAIAENQKLEIQRINKSIRESFYKDENLAEREKKELDKFFFDLKYADKQGNKFSEFSVKWGEIRNDPSKYSKFIKFVKNFDSFEESKVVANKTKANTYNFLKKGASLEGATSVEPQKNRTSAPKPFVFK